MMSHLSADTRPSGVAAWVGHLARQARNAPAAGQGLRTAIVAFGGFALGFWALGRLQIAVFATFGGLALTGIANFGGTRTGRFGANAAAGAAGVGLAALGTWASSRPTAISVIVTFAVGALVVLTGLLGGYFPIAATAVILYYLVAIGSPTPTSVIPDRVIGVLIGGGLAAFASVTLWPGPVDPPILPLLVSRARHLADAISGDTALPSVGGEDDRMGIRGAVERAGYRPAGPARRQRASLLAMNDLERLDRLVRRVAGTPLTAAEQAGLHQVGLTLRAAVDRVGAPPSRKPTARPVADPAAGGPPAEPFSIAYRVRAVVGSTIAHLSEASTGSAPIVGPANRFWPAIRRSVRHGARRIKANLSGRSVHAQDALRTGLALAAAYLAARELNLQHGFWVELATLTVVRSGAAPTSRYVARAVLGTAIGVAIAFAVIKVAGSDVTAYAVITPVAIALAIYLRGAFSFTAGQAGFTVSVLALFSLLKPAGWHIGIVRFQDVLVGTAAGLAASILAWPRGTLAALGPATADLIDRSTDYLAEVVTRLTGGKTSQLVDTPARRSALAAMLTAEAAYAQLISERADQTTAVIWSAVVSTANRLWYVADVAAKVEQPDTADVPSVFEVMDRLRASAADAATRLRHPTRSAPPSADRRTAVTKDPLSQWLADLEEDLSRLGMTRLGQ